MNMSHEMYQPLEQRLLTNSSAARGIVQRQGCGKVKHLDVKTLWIEERESSGDLTVEKVTRLENCSDLLTHHYTEAEAELHLSRMSFERRCSATRTSSEGGVMKDMTLTAV